MGQLLLIRHLWLIRAIVQFKCQTQACMTTAKWVSIY